MHGVLPEVQPFCYTDFFFRALFADIPLHVFCAPALFEAVLHHMLWLHCPLPMPVHHGRNICCGCLQIDFHSLSADCIHIVCCYNFLVCLPFFGPLFIYAQIHVTLHSSLSDYVPFPPLTEESVFFLPYVLLIGCRTRTPENSVDRYTDPAPS